MPQKQEFKGAVDLGKPAPVQQRTFVCEVPGGCNLQVREQPGGRTHKTIADCLETCLPYVYKYLDLADKVAVLDSEWQNMSNENARLVDQNRSLLKANQSLAETNEALERENSKLKS